MNLNEKRIARVARAICYAAGTSHSDYCPVCDPDQKRLGPSACIMVDQFSKEAEAAIKAAKGF